MIDDPGSTRCWITCRLGLPDRHQGSQLVPPLEQMTENDRSYFGASA
jgi:hypothetical protein